MPVSRIHSGKMPEPRLRSHRIPHHEPVVFIPAPFDVATCMDHTGIDPFTCEEVYVAKNLRDRKMQRALMQFFKPENYFMVREALLKAGRGDLIGSGCDCLIPAQPPRAAQRARREQANQSPGEGRSANQWPSEDQDGPAGDRSARRQQGKKRSRSATAAARSRRAPGLKSTTLPGR